MNHLSENEFEDIIRQSIPEPEHLSECDRCRKLLAEKKAVANRMRSAFSSIKANKKLVDNITNQISSKEISSRFHQVGILKKIAFKKIVWPAAAAVFLTAAILGIYVVGPSPAMAARAELVKIHRHNLSDAHEFYNESDPEKLAGYFKDKLGFAPSMPALGKGMALRGCCVRHFQGQIVGSYVVDTPQGVMSVVVVTDKPESLGISGKFKYGGRAFYKSSFAKCDMVSTRLDNYSYCAVGEISYEYLTDLLARLMPEKLP